MQRVILGVCVVLLLMVSATRVEATGAIYPPGTLPASFPAPDFEFIGACDGWEAWYMRSESGWTPGFYQIWGRQGGAWIEIRGPMVPQPGFNVYVPYCSWLYTLPAVSWNGLWGVFQFPDASNHLMTYNVESGQFSDHPNLPADVTYEAPGIWPRPWGERVWDWGWASPTVPVIETADHGLNRVNLGTGEIIKLADPASDPTRVRTPWDPTLEAEIAAYEATKLLQGMWTRYFKLQFATIVGLSLTEAAYNEMDFGNRLILGTAHQWQRIAELVSLEWPNVVYPPFDPRAGNFTRVTWAVTQASVATVHIAQLSAIMKDMARTGKLIIADWPMIPVPLDPRFDHPPDPNAPDQPITAPTPEPDPVEPPLITQAPPEPLPVPDPAAAAKLKIAADYIRYAYGRWSKKVADGVIARVVQPIIVSVYNSVGPTKFKETINYMILPTSGYFPATQPGYDTNPVYGFMAWINSIFLIPGNTQLAPTWEFYDIEQFYPDLGNYPDFAGSPPDYVPVLQLCTAGGCI